MNTILSSDMLCLTKVDDRILIACSSLLSFDRPLNSPHPYHARVQSVMMRYLLYAGPEIISRGNGVDHKVIIVLS